MRPLTTKEIAEAAGSVIVYPVKMKDTHRVSGLAAQNGQAEEQLDLATLTSALAGDQAALNRLITKLTPVIQTRVARKLFGTSHNRDIRQDVKDLTQDVFLLLFDSKGKVLQTWQAERGMSLENFVGLIAERKTISHLRSGRSNPWRESENLDNVIDIENSQQQVEKDFSIEQKLQAIVRCLKDSLSPLGWRLFELLYIFEKSVAEVRMETNMSAEAVYAWRSRLRKQARDCERKTEGTHGE